MNDRPRETRIVDVPHLEKRMAASTMDRFAPRPGQGVHAVYGRHTALGGDQPGGGAGAAVGSSHAPQARPGLVLRRRARAAARSASCLGALSGVRQGQPK